MRVERALEAKSEIWSMNESHWFVWLHEKCYQDRMKVMAA
jgi:hypothetical protein